MTTQVYLVKRTLRATKRNGKRETRYSLRWRDPTTGDWQCEATGTNDRTAAESLRKQRWAELNIPGAAPPPPELEPEPERPNVSWDDCRQAIDRAMRADKLRETSISVALIRFDGLKRMFPEATTPADVTPDMANEYKRRRSEEGHSAWTVKGDLATLKAIFGKWLGRECGFLDPAANPFANVKAPRCDDPDVRIVAAEESTALLDWLAERWNDWKLPAVYLDVAAVLGWRATEIASIREDDLLPDGFVRVQAESCKTRRHKYGWLPPELYADVKACAAGGYAFGRFADELRRLMILWRKRPHHAARVQDFEPKRLVGWLQDELQRFNDSQAEAVGKRREAGERVSDWQPFTLHDFRRTAITGMQMAGVSEKEASVAVGCTPEVMRRHYERLDQLAIAKRTSERLHPHLSLRARCAQAKNRAVDDGKKMAQTVSA